MFRPLERMQIQISTNCVQPFRRRRTQNKKRKFRCVFLYFCSCFTTCVCTTTFYLLLKWRPLLFWFVAARRVKGTRWVVSWTTRKQNTSLFSRQKIYTRLNFFFKLCFDEERSGKCFELFHATMHFFWNVVGYY